MYTVWLYVYIYIYIWLYVYVLLYCHCIHISGGQNYLRLQMDMAQVGCPRSLAKGFPQICTSRGGSTSASALPFDLNLDRRDFMMIFMVVLLVFNDIPMVLEWDLTRFHQGFQSHANRVIPSHIHTKHLHTKHVLIGQLHFFEPFVGWFVLAIWGWQYWGYYEGL